ncbi:MAG TPA: hypothetical protein VNZ01_10745 [Solirubrobacteraceae bacterium]|jgi:hypothetical protein|nr:hypothetical protein [Solirubrobacteraceae bacterium]
MHIRYPDPQIVCDSCGKAEADSEAVAEAGGWLIGYDRELDGHIHMCPGCQEAAA